MSSCIKLSSAFKYGVSVAGSFEQIKTRSARYATSNSSGNFRNSTTQSLIGGSFSDVIVFHRPAQAHALDDAIWANIHPNSARVKNSPPLSIVTQLEVVRCLDLRTALESLSLPRRNFLIALEQSATRPIVLSVCVHYDGYSTN